MPDARPRATSPAGGQQAPNGSQSDAAFEAAEQERLRLASELHDGPAQALANAIFQLEIVERALRADPAAAQRELAALRTILQRELDLMRGWINQLRPDLVTSASLDEALRESAANLTARAGVPVELRLDAPPPQWLDEAGLRQVLRIAQEALRNVGKHAAARTAWVVTDALTLANGEGWRLEVGDDGRGFDQALVERAGGRHFGLRFMRERAALLGAQLELDAADDRGTIVRLTVAEQG